MQSGSSVRITPLRINRKRVEKRVRDVAKKVGTSKSNVLRAKERLNLRTYKKQKQPKRSPKQEASIRPRVRKLYNTILAGNLNCIIMDDETYVKLDYKSLPGPQYYTVREGQVLNQSETSIEVEKFGKKAMVWQAICSCGKISKPFITTASMFTKTTSTHDSKPQGSCCLLARSCFLPLLEINGRMVYYQKCHFRPKRHESTKLPTTSTN